MIREAEMEADKAAETIRAHTSQLRREILELKKNKDNYITRLKTRFSTATKRCSTVSRRISRESTRRSRRSASRSKRTCARPRRLPA